MGLTRLRVGAGEGALGSVALLWGIVRILRARRVEVGVGERRRWGSVLREAMRRGGRIGRVRRATGGGLEGRVVSMSIALVFGWRRGGAWQ